MIDARKQEEIDFHDRLRRGQHEQRWSRAAEARVKNDPMWSNFKYYSIEKHSLDQMHQWLGERAPGSSVLDYCCGNGVESLAILEQGAARVVGIDISPVSIANCNDLAQQAGCSDRVSFRTMDAEALDFADNEFDLAMEYGVLHHLHLPRAMSELARVLKPGGSMVCTETLGHNPLIAWYRRRTPALRTAWEVDHILRRRDFNIVRQHFAKIEMRFFHLATLAAVPFRHSLAFTPLLSALRSLDRAILSVPLLKWQAWQVVFRLSEPVKRH